MAKQIAPKKSQSKGQVYRRAGDSSTEHRYFVACNTPNGQGLTQSRDSYSVTYHIDDRRQHWADLLKTSHKLVGKARPSYVVRRLLQTEAVDYYLPLDFLT